MRGLTNRCGDRERQRMACLNRNERNQPTARANIMAYAFHTAGHIVDIVRKVLLNAPYAGISQACYKLGCVRASAHEQRSEVPD